jgi:hypothetical protein
MPMEAWHIFTILGEPVNPVAAVDDFDKRQQELAEEWLRALGRKHAHDDSVKIDAKAGEISHALHRANASNGSDCLHLVGIEDIHGTLGTSMQILADLSVDQGWDLLRKADRRIDGIGLDVETRCFFGCKISRQHMGCCGLQDVLEGNS